MAKGYTIANENIDFDLLRKSYFSATSFDQRFNWGDLDLIFNVVCLHPDRFPGINFQKDEVKTQEAYIQRWVKGYHNAVMNLPSTRTAV